MVAIALGLAVAACTTQTKDNFTNPPPGPPSSCTQVTALEGCTAGSLSFSCTSDRPDDGDTDLVCDDGAPGVAGATVFCCSLLHEATPVTKGVRYAFVPFLYDEAGAHLRRANLSLVGPTGGGTRERKLGKLRR